MHVWVEPIRGLSSGSLVLLLLLLKLAAVKGRDMSWSNDRAIEVQVVGQLALSLGL